LPKDPAFGGLLWGAKTKTSLFIVHERLDGNLRKVLSDSPLNLPRHGYETVGDVLQDWRLHRNFGISSRRVGALDS
jgi:hypothetical protein